MREFPSCRDYRSFALSVKRHSRFILERHAQEFLATVIETSASHIDTLEAGSELFRAQLGFEWVKERLDHSDPESECIEVEGAYGPERMKPLKDAAREGRINAKGIPCLYLADDPETAMAETRPWIGSLISLARFKILVDLPIIVCPEPIRRIGPVYLTPPHFREPEDPAEREKMVWGEIGYAFSEPVVPSDEHADYAPTQILSEAFRKNGCAGIQYKSRLGKGTSFAIFNPEHADLATCGLFKTDGVSFNFQMASNPYYIKEHFPEHFSKDLSVTPET